MIGEPQIGCRLTPPALDQTTCFGLRLPGDLHAWVGFRSGRKTAQFGRDFDLMSGHLQYRYDLARHQSVAGWDRMGGRLQGGVKSDLHDVVAQLTIK